MAADQAESGRGGPAAGVSPGTGVRARLLEAAERMAGDDYKLPRLAFSLREIAREVGIATPSVYRHFDSKEALIATTVETGFQELLAEMERVDRECDGDAVGRLHSQAIAYCTFLYRRPGLARIMFATRPSNWQPEKPLPNYLGQLHRRWRGILAECRKEGFAMPGDPEMAAFAVWSSVHGSLMLALIAEEDETMLVRAVDQHFALLRNRLTI